MCDQNLNKVKKVVLVMTRVANYVSVPRLNRPVDYILTRDIFALFRAIENSVNRCVK